MVNEFTFHFLRLIDPVDAVSGSLGIVITLIVVAAVATVVAATISIIQSFSSPKPPKLSLGFTGAQQGSPRYGSIGPLDNTISNELPIPVTYGELKVAGNVIWQSDPGETVKRIVVVSEGEVDKITDVRANDTKISKLPGCSNTNYNGTSTQKADKRLPKNLRPYMEMHHTAYIAMTLKTSEKLKGGNPAITSVVKGIKVEVWRDGAWTSAKEFSRNPAACLRDFILSARYGLGIARANVDDASFGEVYDYCEGRVPEFSKHPVDNFTILVLQGDGPNGSTQFLDSSFNEISPTSVNGNVQIDTSQFKQGNASIRFDGAGDYIFYNSGLVDAQFDKEDFTIEFWVRFAAFVDDDTYLMNFVDNTSDSNIGFYLDDGDKLNFEVRVNGSTKARVDTDDDVALNRWYHVVGQRNGDEIELFLDGDKQDDDGINENQDTTPTAPSIYIGTENGTASEFFNGWLDVIKVSKGIARYKSDFDVNDQENRYRLDYVIDAHKPAQDVLTDIVSTFLGFLVYSGSKVKLRVEKEEPVTQYFGDGSTSAANATFDPANIVKDSFQWNLSSLDDRPNRIKVQWVDPDQNYVKVYTQIDDRPDQDSRKTVIPKEISLLGITRPQQAIRMARIHMAFAKYVHVKINFSARLESVHCEIGDVIAVTHQSSQFVRRLFRVSHMQEAEDETIRFTCVEYNASVYQGSPQAVIPVMLQPTGPNPYAALSDVTNLTLREDNFLNKDGVFVNNLLVEWNAIPDDELARLKYYLIQISEDGGATYRDVGFAEAMATSYRIPIGQQEVGKTFTVRVKTVSDRGVESDGVKASLLVSGKVTPPGDVEDFDVNFADGYLAFTWSSIADGDLFGYEIRVGDTNSTWETAGIAATEIMGTSWQLFSITKGTFKYFIKAIDNSGNYSENAASDVITISEVPKKNQVLEFDLFSRISGQENRPLFGRALQLDALIVNDIDSNSACVRMNGATQRIGIPDSPDFDFGTSDFTLEGYFKFDDAVDTYKPLFSKGEFTADKWQFLWRADNQTFQFFARDQGVTTINFETLVFLPVAERWYHIALCRSGTTFRIFIHWYIAGQGLFYNWFEHTDQSGRLPTITDELRIGYLKFDSGVQHFLDGLADEIRISNSARYTSPGFSRAFERGNDVSAIPFEADSNTMALFHLDEAGGPLVRDSSGRVDSNNREHHGMINTDPDWTGGHVGRTFDFITDYPTNDFNPAYNRTTKGPTTFYGIDGLENSNVTFQQFQDNYGFVWGGAHDEHWENESIYETAPIQISGGSSTANYKLDFQTRSNDNTGFFAPYISVSTDGVNYSAFVPFNQNGAYTAKFVKFRFIMQAMNPRAIVRLVSAKLTVDAPDRAQVFLNEAVSAGGRTFNLTGFASVTSIILTTVGTSNLIPRIHDQSNLPSSFDVRMFDTDGVLQAGNINARIDGF